ncbi:hypothetical protein HPB50_011836 [Hyalomma asiaticum]|uniref:Uncharacterized protein n=1 Tax=Hyalomma asiaticum TaxID=266040 RepID=A0ACB7RSK4_HYAAI|nr:hypothetical protein HPB50_011836 [Hyalomma asiaticum]
MYYFVLARTQRATRKKPLTGSEIDELLDFPLSEVQVNALLDEDVPSGSDDDRLESEGDSGDEVEVDRWSNIVDSSDTEENAVDTDSDAEKQCAVKQRRVQKEKPKTPNYWDGDKTEENDASSAATSSLTHQGDQRDGSEDTASVISDSDHLAICTSESSSAEPSPSSSPSPTSSGEEQAVPRFATSIEAAPTESPHANSESFAKPLLGSSRVASLEDAPIINFGRYVLPAEHAYVIPASDSGPSRQALVDSRTEAAPPTVGATQPGLGQRHRSRSRRQQGDRDGSEPKERAGSTENNLRRSKTAVAQGIDVLFIQEANFRSPLDVVAFRRDFRVDAFFSLTNSRACGVGVIFVSGRFRQKSHCTFGADGRMIMLDVYIEGRHEQFFFKDLHHLLLEPLPHVLLGDFNCVVDSQRDVRGPGQGGSTYQAKELVKILRHLSLTDVWVHLHNDHFRPTRLSKTSASRIDRTYLPDYLFASVVECEVVDLPGNLSGKSDHLPFATTVRGYPGFSSRNLGWPLDPSLLHDEVCVQHGATALLLSTVLDVVSRPASHTNTTPYAKLQSDY